MPNSLEIVSCAANSVLLSVVMVLTGSPLPLSSLTTACFPESSFSMSMKQLSLSTKVTTAPLPSFPTYVHVHLPVTPSLSVGKCRPVVNGKRFGIGVLAVREDSSDPIVDGELGFRKLLLFHEPARDLLGRPLLPADEFKDPAADMRRYEAVAGRFGLATPSFQRCQTAVIHSLCIGVAPFLPQNRAYTNTDSLGDETK